MKNDKITSWKRNITTVRGERKRDKNLKEDKQGGAEE